MPTYEYVCRACGHEFEEFQSITADALKKCPTCGKNKLERLIGTGGGFIFKGGGFYETDYRSDKYKKDAKADKESAPEPKDTKSDNKSDTKKSDTKVAKSDTKADTKKAGKKPGKPSAAKNKK